jgi:hypothetical protein
MANFSTELAIDTILRNWLTSEIIESRDEKPRMNVYTQFQERDYPVEQGNTN